MECHILAEISEYKSGVGENARIVPRHLKRPPSEIDAARVLGLLAQLYLTSRIWHIAAKDSAGPQRRSTAIACWSSSRALRSPSLVIG